MSVKIVPTEYERLLSRSSDCVFTVYRDSPAIRSKKCALRGKSIKLSTMIVLDGLIIFSCGPHPNTHRGRHNVPFGGGVWP